MSISQYIFLGFLGTVQLLICLRGLDKCFEHFEDASYFKAVARAFYSLIFFTFAFGSFMVFGEFLWGFLR
jgi:hypothetical protein